MGTDWLEERWPGGRIYRDKRGRKVYVLERMKGDRYTRSLGPITLDQAMAQLARFEEDPEAFAQKPRGVPAQPEVVRITTELVLEFQAHRRAKPCTDEYVKAAGVYLTQVALALKRGDLRTIGPAGLKAALDACPKPKPGGKGPGRGAGLAVANRRLAVVKSFCDWLRTEKHLLTSATDPSLDVLLKPERSKRERGERAYPVAFIEAVYSKVTSQAARDALVLRCRTGMHVTEINRLATGIGKIRPLEGQGEIAATLAYPHKRGVMHLQSIDAQCLAAILRLVARGRCPGKSYLGRALKAATEVLRKETGQKLEAPELGRLRHCFTTWGQRGRVVYPAQDSRVPIETIAAVMGHVGTRNTKDRYDDAEVPVLVVVPVSLTHPDDPPLVS